MDQSNMQYHYFDAVISSTRYDGEYMLDSIHAFSRFVEAGKRSKPNFTTANWWNKVSGCVIARALTLVDLIKLRTSVYTQVSNNLIVEYHTINRQGCVHFGDVDRHKVVR